MKIPATTAGCRSWPSPRSGPADAPAPHLVEEDGGGDGQGTPMAAAITTCSKVPMMAWRTPTVVEASGSAGWKCLWSLVNSDPQWMGGNGLDATHTTMKTTRPTTSRAALTTTTADHPVGGHLALDDLGGAEPGEARKTEYQHTKNPKPPGAGGQLVEDDPDQAERRTAAATPGGPTSGTEVAGPDRRGQPPGRVAARSGSGLPTGRARADSAPAGGRSRPR